MVKAMQPSLLSHLFLFLFLLSFTQVAMAGRQVPAPSEKKQIETADKEAGHQVPAPSKKKQTESADREAGHQVPAPSVKKQIESSDLEGSIAIPGVGTYRVMIPGIRGFDHSGPAALNARYLPGADDTFVPNPGFEVPNPVAP